MPRNGSRDPQARRPGADLRRVVAGGARHGAAPRPPRLRLPVGPRPPVLDGRRSVPAVLRGLDDAHRVGDGHDPDPARADGRSQHVPQPGRRGQDGRHRRPRQRWPIDPRPRRRQRRVREHRPRDRPRADARRAPRLVRGGPRDRHRPAGRPGGHPSLGEVPVREGPASSAARSRTASRSSSAPTASGAGSGSPPGTPTSGSGSPRSTASRCSATRTRSCASTRPTRDATPPRSSG